MPASLPIMTRLRELAKGRGIALVADACHAPGATYKGRKTGTLADISCFSFHPVKHLTTCEGGMALTEDAAEAAHMRRFRNHGIDSDHRTREAKGAHAYDMAELGFNYRLPDVQCALGLAQLKRLPAWVAARQKIAGWYDEALAGMAEVLPLKTHRDRTNAYHLYVVRLADHIDREGVFRPAARRRHRRQCPLCAGLSAFPLPQAGLQGGSGAAGGSRQPPDSHLADVPGHDARRCGAGGGGAGPRHGLNWACLNRKTEAARAFAVRRGLAGVIQLQRRQHRLAEQLAAAGGDD